MDQITSIPIEALRESPFNPRKVYPEGSLLDLAESISTQGILQPIVARPLPDGQTDIEHRFEIIFGHRRYRAACAIKLPSVPVIVRAMTDQEAAIAQVHENLQRVDVSAMEEADSLARLRAEHHMNADQIAEAIGKSQSYVYGRLKMARMAPEVRTAVVEHGLPPDIALELARIPDHNLQRATLKEMKQHDGAWLSVRDAKSRMRNLWRNRISAAPFDITVIDLVARGAACKQCPRLAGNDPDLRGALDADVCTDAKCWDAKTAAAQAIRIEELRAGGHRVIDGDEARDYLPRQWDRPRGLQPLDVYAFDGDDDEDVTFAEALTRLGEQAPKLVVIRNPHDGQLQEYITEDQAAEVLRLLGKQTNDDDESTPSTAARAPSWSPARETVDLSAWSPAERAMLNLDRRENLRRAVFGRLAVMPRDAGELRMMLLREYDLAGGFGLPGLVLGLDARCDYARARWEETPEAANDAFDENAWYRSCIGAMSADELAQMLVAVAVDDFLTSAIYPGRDGAQAKAASMVALVARYGVDAAEIGSGQAQGEIGEAAAGGQADASDASQADQHQTTAARAPAGATTKAPARYRDPATGSTWSGRGLQPKWLKVVLADGRRLEEFEQTGNAGSAGGSDAQLDAFSEAGA